MKGSPLLIPLIILLFISIIDIYVFRAVRLWTADSSHTFKTVSYILYWSIPVIIVILLTYIMFRFNSLHKAEVFKTWNFTVGFFSLFYLPKIIFIVFLLISDMVNGAIWLANSIGITNDFGWNKNSRANFLVKSGVIMMFISFLSIFQGIIWGRFNYKIKKIKLDFMKLPKTFKGFKIIQVSDWHIGSFITRPKEVENAIELINAQNPDLILFTGDMVNNVAGELEPFVNTLSKLSAKYGKYSILGNHDYGEYVNWSSDKERLDNLSRLIRMEEKTGFKVLLNDSVTIKKGQDKIGLAGVENWGLPPFPQYGDLDKALDKITDMPIKILMSHDPSHWDAEVVSKSDVDLTLSGHTHGMQFGLDIPGVKWSPVKWKYPRWSGLYKHNDMKLYVNVGIGYIGFPGRIGIRPEITLFELSDTAERV